MMKRSTQRQRQAEKKRTLAVKQNQGDGFTDVPAAECPKCNTSVILDTVKVDIKICRELLRSSKATFVAQMEEQEVAQACRATGQSSRHVVRDAMGTGGAVRAVGPPSLQYKLFRDVPEDCDWANNLETQFRTGRFQLLPVEQLNAFTDYLIDGPPQSQTQSQYESPYESQYESAVEPTETQYQSAQELSEFQPALEPGEDLSQFQSAVGPSEDPTLFQSAVEPSEERSQSQSAAGAPEGPTLTQSAEGLTLFQSALELFPPDNSEELDLSQAQMKEYRPAGGATESGEEEECRPEGGVMESYEEEECRPAGGATETSEEQECRPAGGATETSEEEECRPAGGVMETSEEQECRPAGGAKKSHEEQEFRPEGGDLESGEEEEFRPEGGDLESHEEQEFRPEGGDLESGEEEECHPAGGVTESIEEAFKCPSDPSQALLELDVRELSSISHSPPPDKKNILREFLKRKMAPCNSTPRNPGVRRVFESRGSDSGEPGQPGELYFQESSGDSAVTGEKKEEEEPAEPKETPAAPESEPEGVMEGEGEKVSEEDCGEDSAAKQQQEATTEEEEEGGRGEDADAEEKFHTAARFSDDEEGEAEEVITTAARFPGDEDEEDNIAFVENVQSAVLGDRCSPRPQTSPTVPPSPTRSASPSSTPPTRSASPSSTPPTRSASPPASPNLPIPLSDLEDDDSAPHEHAEPQDDEFLSNSFRAHSTLDELLQAQTLY